MANFIMATAFIIIGGWIIKTIISDVKHVLKDEV